VCCVACNAHEWLVLVRWTSTPAAVLEHAWPHRAGRTGNTKMEIRGRGSETVPKLPRLHPVACDGVSLWSMELARTTSVRCVYLGLKDQASES
jgi:hypothetical protein